MPDLENLITQWRGAMAKAVEHDDGLLDELESHLREEIDRLIRSGASTTEAFQTAVARFGSPSALGGEFDKLAAASAPTWLPVKIAIGIDVLAAVLLCGFFLCRLGTRRIDLVLATHTISITLGYLTVFLVGGLGLCYTGVRLFHDLPPSQRYALRRSLVTLAAIATLLDAAGIILGMLWAKEHWGRYWAWDPKETGGLMVLLCATMTAGCRWLPRISTRSLTLLAIIGNLATAWAWFGVNLFGVGLHRYGHPTDLVWTLGFCAVHGVFLLAAFLPPNRLRIGN